MQTYPVPLTIRSKQLGYERRCITAEETVKKTPVETAEATVEKTAMETSGKTADAKADATKEVWAILYEHSSAKCACGEIATQSIKSRVGISPTKCGKCVILENGDIDETQGKFVHCFQSCDRCERKALPELEDKIPCRNGWSLQPYLCGDCYCQFVSLPYCQHTGERFKQFEEAVQLCSQIQGAKSKIRHFEKETSRLAVRMRKHLSSGTTMLDACLNEEYTAHRSMPGVSAHIASCKQYLTDFNQMACLQKRLKQMYIEYKQYLEAVTTTKQRAIDQQFS